MTIRISDDVRDEMINHYVGGGVMREVASIGGVSYPTARRRLQDWGVDLQPPGRRSKCVDPVLKETVIRLYVESQLGLDEVSKRTGVSPCTIRNWLLCWGVKMKPQGKRREGNTSGPQKEYLKILLTAVYHDHHYTLAEVGDLLGVTKQAVQQMLRKLEIPTRSRQEASHHRHTWWIPEGAFKQLWESGLTCKEIGEVFGISYPTARSRLVEEGGGEVGPPSPLNYEEVWHLYSQMGMSTYKVAEKLEATPASVRALLRTTEEGVEALRRRKPQASPEKYRRARTLSDSGLNASKIAKKMGVSYLTARSYLQRSGLSLTEIKKRGGRKNGIESPRKEREDERRN